jgi:hypothetical protein
LASWPEYFLGLFFLNISFYGVVLQNWVLYKIKICHFFSLRLLLGYLIRIIWLVGFDGFTQICRCFVFLGFLLLTSFFLDFIFLHLNYWGLTIIIFFNLLFMRFVQPHSGCEFSKLAWIEIQLFNFYLFDRCSFSSSHHYHLFF